MITLETLMLFAPIALALNVTPGADMLFCLGQGAANGPKAGVAASLGIATGSFIHAFFAGVGLAALVAAHPLLFEAVRWIGVGYLVWLAIQTFRHPIGVAPMSASAGPSLRAAWGRGVLVCLLNPKVGVFMLALVPQFVDPAQGSVFVQFLTLGAVLNVGGTVVNALVGLTAGRIGSVLSGSRKLARALQYVTGSIFLGLAAKLAFERR